MFGFGTLPGNIQRAEAVAKVLEVDVFAALDGSSHLCTILSESSVDAFVEQARQRLKAFEVVERYSLEAEGRVMVKFSCDDAMVMLERCGSTGQPMAMESA